MVQLRLKKTSDGHMHSWGSDGFYGASELVNKIVDLIFLKELHPTTVLLTDHCTTKQSREFCAKIEELEDKLKIPIKTYPAVEMSLRYDEVFFHLIAVFLPKKGKKEMWSRVDELENSILRGQKDAYIRKYDICIQMVANYFQNHPVISRDDFYQLTREKVMMTVDGCFIEGGPGDSMIRNYHFNGLELVDGDFRKGASFSHIVETMAHLNELMIVNGLIKDCREGYGIREQIEAYFNQGGKFYVPNKDFLGNLPNITDKKYLEEIKRLTDFRILPHPAKYEHWRELTEELKLRLGILEGIEVYNPKYLAEIQSVLEQAKKLGLKIISGSDFHGGKYHQQKICCLDQDRPLPAFKLP